MVIKNQSKVKTEKGKSLVWLSVQVSFEKYHSLKCACTNRCLSMKDGITCLLDNEEKNKFKSLDKISKMP